MSAHTEEYLQHVRASQENEVKAALAYITHQVDEWEKKMDTLPKDKQEEAKMFISTLRHPSFLEMFRKMVTNPSIEQVTILSQLMGKLNG